MKLIALTGLPRAGKDSFANYMRDMYRYAPMAFAKPLKQASAIILNRPLSDMNGDDDFDRDAIMPEWGFSVRHFLQYMGTEVVRQFDKDLWVKNMRTRISQMRKVVITDLRFENETAMVHDLGGSVVSIKRPGTVDNGHVSNKPMPFDFEIHNDGSLDQLHQRIDALVRSQQWG